MSFFTTYGKITEPSIRQLYIILLGGNIMKERMKLTEKELAIGMWQYIKTRIVCDDNSYGGIYVTYLKRDYLSAHNCLNLWKNDCILCDKYLKCELCPLNNCIQGKDSLYRRVCGVINYGLGVTRELENNKYSRDTRLEACDKIIGVIERFVPDDYVTY